MPDRLLGYGPEDTVGNRPYEPLSSGETDTHRTEAHEKALEGQGAVSVTYRIRKRSGEYIWFETLTEPILGERSEVVRLQTASRDVSERKRAEQALAEAARAKAEFLAEVSHELRTPLTVIRGNAEIGLELDRDHEEILHEIVRESSTMSRMVEDLLFLARSESAAPPFRMGPVEAKVLLSSLAHRANPAATRREARYTLSGTGLVRVDPMRVEQAILPSRNAVQYDGRPEHNPEVRLLGQRVARRGHRPGTGHTRDGAAARLRTLLPAVRPR